MDLKTNQVMVEYASNDLFHPASNIKLLTSAAALHVLGARHRWLTLVGTDRVKNQSIGNLIVRGGGDPSLGDIAEWALKLMSQGILSIEGDIIIDASLFKSFGLPPGFEEKNQDGAYRPSISSINLNWNHILIKVTDRGKAAGHVAVFPPNDYVKIINQTRVTKKVKRPILVKQKVSKTNQQVVVKGELKRKKSRSFRRRIGSPLRFFEAVLRHQLSVYKIQFRGQVRFESNQSISIPLIEHESKPLSDVLKAVNSWSNNLTAEVLVLSIAKHLKRSTTFKNGLSAVSEFASEIVHWNDFHLTNGSGLFGSTRTSAQQMTRLLTFMYAHRDRYPDYRPSLAVAGEDGTMKNRLKDLERVGVFAKTGTLDGVSGLSGYLLMPDARMVAFSILQNDFTTSSKPIRQLQDDIVRVFVEGYLRDSNLFRRD